MTENNKSKSEWDRQTEQNEKPEHKQICKHFGNEIFRIYITTFIDDARLYCAKCGKFDL